MGKVKQQAIDDEQHAKELRWLEAEKQYELNEKQFEIDELKMGMPKTLGECHDKIITLLGKITTLHEQINKMRSWGEWFKNQGVAFILGVLASTIASWVWLKIQHLWTQL